MAQLSSVVLGFVITGCMLRLVTGACGTVHRGSSSSSSKSKSKKDDDGEEEDDDDGNTAIFAIDSTRFLAKWWSSALVEASGKAAEPFQGTMFMQLWVRLMGAKVEGWSLEFSSSTHVGLEPGNMTIGAGAFVADSAFLAMPAVDRGHM